MGHYVQQSASSVYYEGVVAAANTRTVAARRRKGQWGVLEGGKEGFVLCRYSLSVLIGRKTNISTYDVVI